MLFFIFLSLEYIFTFPSVKQRATSGTLFGIYPDTSINIVWNPAFLCYVNKYWLDLLRLKELYKNFIGYRMICPIIQSNKVYVGGMIFLSEGMPRSSELYEHTRGEIFLGYNRSIKYGASVFVARKDWWCALPWSEGWNYIFGAKCGFIFPNNSSFSIIASKEDTASTFELLSYFSHTLHNYGFTCLLNLLSDFIGLSVPHTPTVLGAYHINHLQKGKFIKAIKFEQKEKEIKYLIPLVLEFNIFGQLNLHGGYTIETVHFEEKVNLDAFISMGVTYKLPKLAVIVNMGEYPYNTNYWEVSFSYGH